ncbi:dihydropteroate synthase [Vibrio rumoiensis]|uniref:Dihydropteroate synthase n=1 Tax=Vibrio rumoiensis 1S-45 TaxID=1188252 RepID=A0A1E5E2Q9_9VIBR|nr:dihydropteroate synthase [Vibrio rumoiensis]OEF25837.1 dihydropteroate synthase [Vibrio rumoiensis 1S-45]
MFLNANGKTLDLTEPKIMGILNMTPDSFSDGGKFNHLDKAMKQVESMILAGATIIDVGGESTRPGAQEVSVEDELNRVIPLVRGIKENFDVWISLDTSKADVMSEGITHGVDLINDIRALREPGSLEVAAKANIPVCIMHMQGQPRTMQHNPVYDDVLKDVCDFLEQRIKACEEAGIVRENIILDPGFGFGKSLAHNYHLLANLEQIHQFGLPILAGMSRKSMISKLLDKVPAESVVGSVICATIAAQKGAQIIRVHDVAETQDAMRVLNMVQINKN